MSGLADGTRLRVKGNASAEEVAAVVVALDAALAGDRQPARRTPGWQTAARLEAVTNRVVRSRGDLDTPTHPGR